MVAEGHRLCHLQVGHAWHYRGRLALGEIENTCLEAFDLSIYGGNLVAQPEPNVSGDLIVAGASRV